MKLSRSLWLPGRTRPATSEPRRADGMARSQSGRSASAQRARQRAVPARRTLPAWIPRGPVQFVQEAYYELKRVRWPSREETIRLTTAVIAFSVVMGAFLGLVDFIFARLFELLLR